MVKQVEFENLARLPVIEFYEAAFRKATGASLKVVPPGEPRHRLNLGKDENAFCRLAAGTPSGCDACLETQIRVQRLAGKKLTAQQINCFCGLTDVAVPVVIGGRHVATLLSGQVFRREPTERDFKMVAALPRAKRRVGEEGAQGLFRDAGGGCGTIRGDHSTPDRVRAISDRLRQPPGFGQRQ